MNIKQLTYLLTIAECQSLSAAAARLPVSQPALSKYLTELEEELGTELFLRHNRHLYPTNAGRIYLEAARKIINVKEQTYHTIAGLSRNYRKTLIVGGTPLRGAMGMSDIYYNFQRRYPDVQLIFKEQYAASLRQSIGNGTIHMAITTCVDSTLPGVQIATAHKEEVLLFVPAFHPLAAKAQKDRNHPASIDICEFQDTPFLAGTRGSTIRALFDAVLEQQSFTPTIVFETDNNLILKNMVKNGVGACLLPQYHVDSSSEMVYFSLRPRIYAHMSILFPENHELSEEERFITALLFAEERNNKYYTFHPNPLAEQILREFDLYEACQQNILK